MTTLADIRKFNAASDLVHAGLRLSLIVAITGMKVVPVRRLWKEIYGRSPPNGKLPESVISFATSQRAAGNLSAFVSMHMKLHSSLDCITAENLLSTWKTFIQLCSPLDINAGYYALRDVRTQSVLYPKCPKCGAHYIYDRAAMNTSRCPFCCNDPSE